MTPGTIIAAGYPLIDSDRQSLAKRIDAEIAPLVEAQWQPIKTAPKDGSWVQIARPGEYLGAARYMGYCDGHSLDHATHWMPLPAPPQAMAKAKQEPQP